MYTVREPAETMCGLYTKLLNNGPANVRYIDHFNVQWFAPLPWLLNYCSLVKPLHSTNHSSLVLLYPINISSEQTHKRLLSESRDLIVT